MTGEELVAHLADEVLLLDGGMGTLLMAMGLASGAASETWNLEHPERVVEAHRRFVAAGSEVVHTNTFGGSPVKLAAAGLEGRCREVNGAAVRLAREAAFGTGTLVAGDVGPTGVFLVPVGQATEELYERAFREQVGALAEAGVDLISIETMYDLREALAAVRAARAETSGLPILASMTFEARRRGYFTMMGDRIVPSLRALADAGADVVGFNCSVGSEVMVGMVREARDELELPLLAQPNAGQPRAGSRGLLYDATPERFAGDVARMVEAGARVVGGCCGTDPDFIRAIRGALDSAPASESAR